MLITASCVYYRRTPLMHASFRGRTDTVKYLLEHGADPHYVSSDGESALSEAASYGKQDIVKLLHTEYNADIEAGKSIDITAISMLLRLLIVQLKKSLQL